MHSAARSGRRLATILTSIGLAALVASSSVLASTPVTVGYRDHLYGGGAFRPAGDKPQSKLWFTDNTWFAGMFYAETARNFIWRLDESSQTWVRTSTVVDLRDMSHADYLWDEASQTLYVVSTSPIPNTVPAAVVSDGIQFYKYTYDAATNAYTADAGNPKVIQNTASDGAGFSGGAPTVTIALDSNGDLWAAWPRDGEVKYSRSEDGGATWSDPAQVPVQPNSIAQSVNDELNDTAAVIAFGAGAADTVGIIWSDQDDAPTGASNGYYFARIAAGVNPLVAGNWTLESLPDIAGTTTNPADNHINIKAHSDGTLYMVGKTNADTALCATNKASPLIPFYDRTTGGTWTAHLAGTVGDCNTRPQVVISEELDTAYLFMTSPNGGGAIYRKSAPLSGPDAFDFRGAADQTIQRGTPFIQSAQQTMIDDPSTTKQSVTAASGIVVIGSNISSSATNKYYLHNQMAIAATDAAAPTGTVSINGGAATTNSQTVSVAVPATDAGSGVSLVRLSNNSDMSSSTTFVYTTPISWTLTAGFGAKTVYVEWRDSAGNWSGTSSDSITYAEDTTAPNRPAVVTHRIFGSGRFGIPVRVEWPAASDNPGGSGVQSYVVHRSVNGGAFAFFAETPASTTPGLSMDLPNSVISYRFRVYTKDNRDNLSTSPRYGSTFTTRSYSESNPSVRYTGSWSVSNSAVYIGGKAKISSVANSSATLSFSGNQVGWYSRLGPTHGQARVYIDGVLSRTVNLFSSTVTDRKLVYTKFWSSVGNHSIRIVVVGTSGHPKVVVDQIFVLR